MLRGIIIDNTEVEINSLKKVINVFFSTQLLIIVSYTSPKLALLELENITVDVIFIDIEMPELNGFEFIACLPQSLKNKVVLFTAHERYAINAIKEKVRFFLSKPVVLSELKECLHKLNDEKQQQELALYDEHDMLMVVGQDKTQFFNCHKISRIQANRSYCVLYYEDKQISVTKSLKFFEEKLPESVFYRAHRSHLINYNFIVEIRKNATGSRVFLKDGTVLEFTNMNKMK
jgi:two-component system LytT family response regulator